MATTGSTPPTDLATPKRVEVTMDQGDDRPGYKEKGVPLWVAILNRRIDFKLFTQILDTAFCPKDAMDMAQQTEQTASAGPKSTPQARQRGAVDSTFPGQIATAMSKLRQPLIPDGCAYHVHGLNSYELLKTAAEIFVLLECGVFIAKYEKTTPPEIPIPGTDRVQAEGLSPDELLAYLSKYLPGRLPYIEHIVGNTPLLAKSVFCEGFVRERLDCPCFIELIWSYWQEEGMLVQGLNALSRRFQNRRSSADGRDPLAQLELSPLRPLSSIFWGYVQDEQHRLSVMRRNTEYEHEYGVSLRGKAVPPTQVADRRSKFIEAFHDLLFRCSQFIRDSSNLQFRPNAFPLLTGLKEVHLILSQGAGNQFGDLPWTARVEMLIQQWILSRNEIKEFLGRRPMVAYEEEWMANADALKTLMGWTDTSVVHFHTLAKFGEKLLLSIRWYNWGDETDGDVARNWLDMFRPMIESYIYSYRIATGVDLSLEPKDSRAAGDRSQNPSVLLERRLGEQRRNGRS